MPHADKELITYSITWQERPRSYIVYRPSNLSDDISSPLVIMLHGGGSSSALVLEKYDWTIKADKEGFVLALPDAAVPFSYKPASVRYNPRSWNDGSNFGYAAENGIDDVGFINRITDEVVSRYTIDPKCVYVTGFSNGASMALRVGIELSAGIAAIAPVSGHLWMDNIIPGRPVPMIYIIGTEDPINPLNGGYSHLPWNKRVLKPPVKETIDRWLRLNGCGNIRGDVSDENGVKKIIFGSETGGFKVLYYEVEGLGHVWPGGVEELPRSIVGKRSDRLKATDVIWDFFKAHPMV